MNEKHDHSHDTHVKKVDQLSSTRVRLTVEFANDTLSQHEHQVANRYSRVAKIPGFRPGKAPLSIVKSKYKDEIRQDVVSHLLEAGLSEAIKKSDLRPVSRPTVQLNEIVEGKPFGFQAEFDVQPEITLKKYKDIPVKKADTKVTDEDVKKVLESYQDRLATLEPATNTQPEKGQFGVLEVGYELVSDPTKKEDPKTYTLELGEGKLLPKLEEAFLKLSVGEEKEVVDTFPADYSDPAVAGKDAKFKCKLVELKKKNRPELNDDFAKQLRDGMTLETLKEDVRKNLQTQKEEEAKKEERQQMMDYLIKNNPFDVAGSMIEEQASSLVQWMEDDWKKRGMKAPKMSDEEMKSVRERAETMVRNSLILRELARKENIQVDENRITGRIEDLAKQMSQPVEDVRKLLTGRGLIDRMRDEILTDQVFEFLLSQAKIKN